LRAANHHIIHRQVIELDLNSPKDAYRRQRQASELFQTTVSDALQQAFDDLGLGANVLQIAKLEIDLGDINSGNFEREFTEKCTQAVRRAVQEAHATARWTGNVVTASATNLPMIASLIKGEVHLLEAFRQFLLTGRLPASLHRKNQAELDELWDDLLATSKDKVIALLASYSPNFGRILPRLVRQFRPAWIAKLINDLRLKNVIEQEITSEKKLAEQSTHLKQEVTRGNHLPWWRALPASVQATILAAAKEHFQRDFWSLDKDRQLTVLEVIIASLLTAPGKLELTELKRDLDRTFFSSGSTQPKGDQSLKKVDNSSQKKALEKIATEEDHLYVTGAGIVIIHPFLPKLLEHLGWIKNGEWVSQQLQERALHLLAYLTAGEQSASEHEMLLAKILCGYPLDQLVDRFIELTPEEKSAADELLTAVVSHWKALGNSSPEALRQTFLQRDGVLNIRPNGYLLRVERKSPDVLLEKLPWGIGLLHFPWLTEKITVEW
jgi:hypothetical protein